MRVWENETGNCTLSLTGHREPVYTVSYSPDAKFIATGSSDKSVNIWSTQVQYNSSERAIMMTIMTMTINDVMMTMMILSCDDNDADDDVMMMMMITMMLSRVIMIMMMCQ